MKRIQIIYAHQPKSVALTITEQQAALVVASFAAYHTPSMFKRRVSGWNVLTSVGSLVAVSFAHIASLVVEEEQVE